jgi:hypothetical protein
MFCQHVLSTCSVNNSIFLHFEQKFSTIFIQLFHLVMEFFTIDVLSTCFVLSTGFVNIFGQYVLSTGFVNMLCQQVLSTGLSTCFVNIHVLSICQHVLSTYMFCQFVNMFCQQVLSTGFVNRFCQQVLSTCSLSTCSVNNSIFLHFEQNFHKPGNQRKQQRYV